MVSRGEPLPFLVALAPADVQHGRVLALHAVLRHVHQGLQFNGRSQIFVRSFESGEVGPPLAALADGPYTPVIPASRPRSIWLPTGVRRDDVDQRTVECRRGRELKLVGCCAAHRGPREAETLDVDHAAVRCRRVHGHRRRIEPPG